MENNNQNTKTVIKREIAGYDSHGNPIYREISVPLQVRKPQTVIRNVQTTHGTGTHKKALKRKKKAHIKKILLLAFLLILIILVVFSVIKFFRNHIGFSDSVQEAIGVSQNDVIYTFKVDDDHRITVYKLGGKLCADLMLVNGDSFKSIKSCSPIDLESYKSDLTGKKMNYTKSGDICFALDFAESDQYDSFQEYISENASKTFNPGAISVDENNKQIFVLWYWTE